MPETCQPTPPFTSVILRQAMVSSAIFASLKAQQTSFLPAFAGQSYQKRLKASYTSLIVVNSAIFS
jgi:hypothetical protein